MAGETDSLLNSSTGRKAVGALPSYGAKVSVGVPGIQPAFGAQALGSAISRLGQVADQGMDEVGRRQYQQAALDGAKAGFDAGSTTAPAALGAKLPQDPSAYGDAFRRGAVQAASAQVGLQARASVLDLADKYKLDPTGFGQAAEASMRGFVGGLPPELRDTALDHYSGWTYRALGQISDRWHEQQRGQQRATISEAIGTYTADTGALAAQGDAPGTLDSFAKAKAQIDAAVANGVLSPEEGQRTTAGLQEHSGMSYLRGALLRSPDPEATVRGLKDGKTGDDVGDAVLAMLPMDKRFEIISKAEVEAKDRRLQSDTDFRNQFNQQIATDPLAALETARNYDKQNHARLYAAVEGAESGGDAGAVSPKGALGAMQLMPDTAREAAKRLGLAGVAGANDADLRSMLTEDAGLNRRLGQEVLGTLLDRYDGNRTLALAAYNAGPGKVDEWLKSIGDPRKGDVTDGQFAAAIPYAETRGYLTKVIADAGPEDKTAGLAIKSAMGQAAKFAQADLYERQKGEVTSRMNGAPIDNAISEAEIRKAYPSPLEADKAVDHWRKSAAVADATGMLPGSSLQARQATLAAMRPTDPADTEGWDRYNAFAKAVQADNEKLLGDPGTYARDKSPRVQQALAAAQGDPGQMAAAIGQSIAYQEHMGLNPEQVRPLPKDTVSALVTQYKEAPRVEDRLGTIGFVAAIKDPAVASKVMAQLKGAGLPKGTEFAVALAQEGDTANATELATRLSMDAGKEADFTELKSRDIEKAVDASFNDPSSPARALLAAAAASGQPIDREQGEEMRTTVLRVAKQYAREPGESEGGAAQRAVALVLGNRKVVGYEGLGTVRVPTGTDTHAFLTGMEAIREGLDLSHVAPTEGMVRAMLGPQASAGEVQGALNAATRDHDALERWFRTEGTWVDAPGGYALVGPHGGAVPNPDGTTRVWTADEVAGAARRSPTGTGMQPTYDPVRPLS